MNSAIQAQTSNLNDVAAMALGLGLLSVGSVTLIGGTGLFMWVFGL